MATTYDVVNATDLPQETSTTLDGTEQLIGFDTAQGKRITVAELAEYILQKKLSSLAGSSQTVAAALSALNSNARIRTVTNVRPATFTLTDTSWQCFLVIGNITGGGNVFSICTLTTSDPIIEKIGTYNVNIDAEKDGNSISFYCQKDHALVWKYCVAVGLY